MLSASDLSRVRAASDKPTPPPPLVAAGVSPCSSVTTTKKQSPPRNNLFALSTSAQLPLPVASDSVFSSNLLHLEPVLAAQKAAVQSRATIFLLSAHTHSPIAPTASPARPPSLPKRLIPPDRCNAPDLPSYSPGNALAASTNPIVSAGPPLQLLRIYHRAFFWPL